MSDLKIKKTELQKEFEAQTPTIKGIYGNEYNMVYCAWLEYQVEKLRKANDLKTSASGLHLQNVNNSALPTLKDFAVNTFKAIGKQTERLTSGNASHQGMTIKGSANRAAEFIEKHYC